MKIDAQHDICIYIFVIFKMNAAQLKYKHA